MRPRYILAPEAAIDMVNIWRYFRQTASLSRAEQVRSVIREKLAFLSRHPGAGHWRIDLTDQPLKFYPVYSYLIVYRPNTTPLQVLAILHGRRDMKPLLDPRIEC